MSKIQLTSLKIEESTVKRKYKEREREERKEKEKKVQKKVKEKLNFEQIDVGRKTHHIYIHLY